MEEGKSTNTAIARYVVIGGVLALLIYSAIFIVAYEGRIQEVAELLSRSRPENAVFIVAFRLSALILHVLTWWLLLYPLTGLRIVNVLRTALAAIFTELVIPIGGVTEVAKVALITKVGEVSVDAALTTLLTHRFIASVAIALTTFVALYYINAPQVLYVGLLGPALVLVASNILLCLVPASPRAERLVCRLSRRVCLRVKGFSGKYVLTLKSLGGSYKYLAVAVVLALGERLSNAYFGMHLASLMGVKLSLGSALLAFDSLYTIIWLLPAITPGGLGVFEAIQTTLLTYIGIPLNVSATLSILSRAFYVVVEYPLFMISIASLGLSLRGYLREVIRIARPGARSR
ncbi:MAG: hypothetical protein B6U73_03605 [Desulfurococcales archaeon ex4484_204]|nr:MAG: hypothetical protein B6U73_03605 [Desulfurococcales archaeon ex4484_204]